MARTRPEGGAIECEAAAAYRSQASQSGYASGGRRRWRRHASMPKWGRWWRPARRGGGGEVRREEVVIGIPEDKVETLRGVKDVTVPAGRPEAGAAGQDPRSVARGDAATRTYLAKVSIPDARGRHEHDGRGAVRLADSHAADQVPLAACSTKIKVPCGVVENGAVSSCP
jgi:hypothetical protein